MAPLKQLTIRKTDKLLEVIAQAQREGLTIAEFIYRLYERTAYAELLAEWKVLHQYVMRIHAEHPFEAGDILATVEMKIKTLEAK